MCLFEYYFSVCIDNLLTLYNLLHTLLHCILYAEGAFGKQKLWYWKVKKLSQCLYILDVI